MEFRLTRKKAPEERPTDGFAAPLILTLPMISKGCCWHKLFSRRDGDNLASKHPPLVTGRDVYLGPDLYLKIIEFKSPGEKGQLSCI